MNLKRRHLSVTQRGLIGAQLKSLYAKGAKERQGHGQTAPGKTLVEKLPEALGRARDQAGAAVGVSGKTIDAAVIVKEQGQKLPQLTSQLFCRFCINLSTLAGWFSDWPVYIFRQNVGKLKGGVFCTTLPGWR